MLLLLIPFLLATNSMSPSLLPRMAGEALWIRILITLVLTGPPAVLMGFYFPLGMTRAQEVMAERTEWLWAINGALSVLGSVLAMVCSLAFGISGTLMIGTGMYLAAAGLLLFL
jgi:hypothetical protein